MTASATRSLWIIKTGDALPPLRATHGDFEDWIARGLALGNGSESIALQTLDARTTTRWPALASVAGVVVTGRPPW